MKEIIVILAHPTVSKDNCMICNVFLRSVCAHNATLYMRVHRINSCAWSCTFTRRGNAILAYQCMKER